jgi:hypothetical protein
MKKTFFFKINDFSLPALGSVVLSLVALWVLKFALASESVTVEDSNLIYYVVALISILTALFFLYRLTRQEFGIKQSLCFYSSILLIVLNLIIEGAIAGENISRYYFLIFLLSGQFILTVICYFTYLLPLDSFVLIFPRDKDKE